MGPIAVAAISARLLAEAAAREGIGAVALDLFGDRDTRNAALQWHSIGSPGSLRIDAARLLQALCLLAERREVQGWVAGAGFDGRPDLLEQGAACAPLLGTDGADVRRVRDPATFFGFLQARGTRYPQVRYAAGPDTQGWLLKDPGACGGWHIRRAAGGAAEPHAWPCYWQREVSGTAMSATFVADGADAVLLGFNEQIVRAIGARPFVFSGVLGPVPVSDAVQREVSALVRALADAFALRGLGSLDFVLDGQRVWVLELNPRPPASMALYPRVGHHGALHAHLRACLQRELPAAPQPTNVVGGSEIVYAPRALHIDDATATALASRADTHDLPFAGTAFAPGDPICSVSASGCDADSVKIALARRREALLHSLETPR